MKVAVYSNFYGDDNLVHGNVNFNRVDPAIPHYFFTNNQVAGHKCVAAGWTVMNIHLNVIARLPKVTQSKFIDAAVRAKTSCLVSRLLRANISMNAKLEK